MKKGIWILLICALLTACTRQPSAPPQASTEATQEARLTAITLFLPNDNADSFEEVTAYVQQINADAVMAVLMEAGVLEKDVAVNTESRQENQLTLDVNRAFQQQLCSYGTAGEQMLLGSVVNTFLRAYDVESVMITVEGETLESGHGVYDTPMGFFNMP